MVVVEGLMEWGSGGRVLVRQLAQAFMKEMLFELYLEGQIKF